jgi:lipopolysaccharide/colanic/teichoic acid biosynthesis glycosyltransferase
MEFFKMSFYQRAIKRGGDILISLICLVILSPLMGIIALAIKAEDHGPVFFRQRRLTIRGWEFTIWKFRTMTIEDSSHESTVSTAINDPRVTRVGRVLRHFRMDEIPQFLNVLRGEMSLVGPRPELLQYVSQYQGEELDILKVRPGITDYSSVEFVNLDEIVGTENADEMYEKLVLKKKNALRVRYAHTVSLRTDLEILFRTAAVVLDKIFESLLDRKEIVNPKGNQL